MRSRRQKLKISKVIKFGPNMIQSHKGSKERKQKFISIQLDEKSCIKNVNVGVTKYLPSSQRKLHMHWIWNTPFMASNRWSHWWFTEKERKKERNNKLKKLSVFMESFQGFLRLRQWLDYFIVFFSLYLLVVCVSVF